MYYKDRYTLEQMLDTVFIAYNTGETFDTVINSDNTLKTYYTSRLKELARQKKAAEQEKERKRKNAEKMRQEAKDRAEVLSKLSPEEVEALGYSIKGTKLRSKKSDD